jgi:8-oxo-dGTP pyrophosphatase MutT (NUDIX family)
MNLLTPSQQTTLIILAGTAVLAVLAFLFQRVARRAAGGQAIQRADADGDLPGPWRALRDDVEMSNRMLNRQVFDRARQLFLDYYAAGKATPASLTSEYTREEFLVVLDEQGRPAPPQKELLERYRKTLAVSPEFARWFRAEIVEEGEWAGTTTLLAARWLCHLVGLRHGTVEIFIDPPDLQGHTLVQVRGMDKFEAPGAFDIPCAGHIDGLDSVEKTLAKELSEELNLKPEDLYPITLIARYNSYTGDDGVSPSNHHTNNNEHRVLFRAQLKPEAAAHIRFSDGEVAGLSVFAVSELRALVQQYPERVASGLADAIGFYT